MKKLFSNRVFATCLTVVLMIVSVVMNTRVKLGKQCEALDMSFYSENSISDSLQKLCDASSKICFLARQFDIDEVGQTEDDISSLQSLLDLKEKNLAHIHSYYESLLTDTFRLESALSRAELSEEGRTLLSEAQHDAAAAKASIDASDYNDRVRTFLKYNDHFPTAQISAVSGVRFPQVFA